MSFRRHLVRWEDEYAKKGLAVVEISGGKLATLAESRTAAKKWGLRHPVLWDENNQNHLRYGIASWPSAYLIGADGKVFWEGNPAQLQNRAKELAELKRIVEGQLREAAALE